MTAREASRLRFDVATDDWVLFAPARSRRPHPAPEVTSREAPDGYCPFCPGHESDTPGEIERLGAAGGGASWLVRVVPNKFPALEPSTSPEQTERGRSFREMGGYGAHEVVIESPDHSGSLSRMPVEQIERIPSVLHDRFTALMKDERLRAIVVFKNHGQRAGTSLAHPHWQIIATPVVPHQLRLKHAVAADYFDRTGKCLYSVALEDELQAGERVLVANEAYVAVLPFASRVPYQIRILPRAHHASFGRVERNQLLPLASVLQHVLARLDAHLGGPHFNLAIDTAPIGDENKRYFLWHIDVLPRMTTPAGFELGSGMSVNSILPEEAARELRAEPDQTGAGS